MTTRATLSWLDEHDSTATTSIRVGEGITDPSEISPVVGALQGSSSASIEVVTISREIVYPGVFGVGPYTIQEVARLTFAAPSHMEETFDVPAPKPEMFLQNQQTVDRNAPIVDDLITETLLTVTCSDGMPVTRYVRGSRQ